ncbi:MAG: FAD-dependent oxidoreductase [Clostridia bacterium]|nr:FAD-dependent oxidoreductase [Clostridia bacterium]
MNDILIIGAGMAGLTSAIYAVRAGRSVLVLEREGIGGQIATSPKVENYPAAASISGAELSDRLFEQATSLGAELDFGDVTSLEQTESGFVAHTEDGDFEAKSVIIASGVHHRKLGTPREEELFGRGVSYCAVCDGAFYKGKRVAVVGGGNTALSAAVFLAGICAEVTLIHRRDEFRAERYLVEQVKKLENVRIVTPATVEELLGEDKLSGLRLSNGEEIALEGLFVCIGKVPDNAAFSALVDLTEDGFIDAGEDCRTRTEGVFVAGDCRKKEIRQLTTAAADGSVAALAACDYLNRIS